MTDQPLDQLAFYIGRAHYAYVGWLERLLAQRGLEKHLRPGMGPVLCALYREDDLSIKQIAAQTQLSLSTLTGMLQRMERAGLIKRRRDQQDGRVVRVRLSRLARSLENDVWQVADDINQAFIVGLGQREVVASRCMLLELVNLIRTQSKVAQHRRRTFLASGESP